eukprot:SAG31_NODE_7099_length_1789_cov_1.333728_1_plen_174_part_00
MNTLVYYRFKYIDSEEEEYRRYSGTPPLVYLPRASQPGPRQRARREELRSPLYLRYMYSVYHPARVVPRTALVGLASLALRYGMGRYGSLVVGIDVGGTNTDAALVFNPARRLSKDLQFELSDQLSTWAGGLEECGRVVEAEELRKQVSCVALIRVSCLRIQSWSGRPTADHS